MKSKEVECLITTSESSVVDNMKKIDENVKGILFVVNDNKQLIGSVTDGDIRRWLIKTGKLDATVLSYMNQSPKFLFDGNRNKAYDIMKEYSIKSVPIVDADKKIIDVIFADELISAPDTNKNKLNDTSVIIMAGGKGTRLYPYTKILPKPLIPIGDVPILERIINRFCEYGISHYYLTVNYKKGMIKSYFAELRPDYCVKYVEEDSPLGTAGSIKLITDKFESPVIITNCDTLIDVNYSKLIEHHVSSGNALTIVSALKNTVIPYGVINAKEQGVIVSMEEKPRMSYFINTGLYVLNPELIEKIPDNKVFHMPELAELLMRENFKVGMYPISEEAFLDMGEFDEMRRMEKKLNIDKI